MIKNITNWFNQNHLSNWLHARTLVTFPEPMKRLITLFTFILYGDISHAYSNVFSIPPLYMYLLTNVANALFKRNEYHTTNNHRFERRWRTQYLGFATKSRAFHIFQVYQYFYIYRWQFLLKFEQYSSIFYTTLFKIRRYQRPF